MGLYDVGSVRVRGDMDLSDSFAWNEYLEKTGGTPAAWECFRQSRTPPENIFEVDSLLEAVDQRIALNETLPPLQHSSSVNVSNGGFPASVVSTSFSSEATTDVVAANSPSPRQRRRRFSSTVGVQQPRRFRFTPFSLARVIETAGPRLRVRLVGTDDRNDCWFLVDSDEIRPYPSHETLQPPFGYVHNHLVWNKTLHRTVSMGKAAPVKCFVKPPPGPERNLFKNGDKLEAVDRHNAQLICPATIGEVSGLHVLVSFDGWSGNFDYWTRYDSRDLFPCGWCKLAGYALQFPGPTATQHLNLTPTKMPVPRPLEATSPSKPVTISVRRSAPTRRKRLTLASSISNRRRLSVTGPVVHQTVLNFVPTMKPKKIAVPASAQVYTPDITCAVTSTTTAASAPQPPLPRLTVITKTLEDGSPQTIIKTTSSMITSSSGKPNHEHGSVVESSTSTSKLSPSSMAEFDSVKRKRRKWKKHRRQSSKKSHHKHSNYNMHHSVRFGGFGKSTKLVIQRSNDPCGSSTAQLFVDTMVPSPPPPISTPFSDNVSPSIELSSQRSPVSACGGNNGDPPFSGQKQMPTQSTVSPASMDLGPCPLPSVTKWSSSDVYNYLTSKESSLMDVASTFKQQDIDGSALLLLDIETMRSLLSVKLGPALKIDDIVNQLKQGHL